MFKSYKAGVIFNYLVHLGVLGLFFFAIPSEYHHGWYFHHGGDQETYYELGASLAALAPAANKFPLGFPLLLAIPIALFRPADWQALVPLFVIVHAFVLHGLAQLLLGAITFRMTRSRRIAWLAVLVWVLLPLIYYIGLAVVHSPALAAERASHLAWVQMLSDPPAAFLTLLVVWLWFKGKITAEDTESTEKEKIGQPGTARQEQEFSANSSPLPFPLRALWVSVVKNLLSSSRPTLILMFAAGALGGFLGMVRLSGLLAPAALALLMLYRRRWRETLMFGAGALVGFAPQLLYNAHFFGSPFTTGYQAFEATPDGAPVFNPAYLLDGAALVWRRAPLLVLAGVPLLVLGSLAALGWLWRRDHDGALVIGGWALSYLIFYGSYYYSWEGALTRLLIPAYPALAVMAVGFAAWVGEKITRRSRRPRYGKRPN
ncbi:MAG: hypothetical protein JXB47_14330 [Anaerolineae bacterium]|nr:hypothetical protein [Anaerolineae bacterium]